MSYILRTLTQTVTDAAAGALPDVLDIEGNILGLTASINGEGTLQIQGKSTDDFVAVPGGVVAIDVPLAKSSAGLPRLRAASGSITVDLFVDTEVAP